MGGNESIKIWILCGLVVGMGTVFAFLAKWFFNEVLTVLSDIKAELKRQNTSVQGHEYQITSLVELTKQQNERLNRHSIRIEELEKQFLRHIRDSP